MSDPVREQEHRSLPAMAASTRERGVLYRRIVYLLYVIGLVDFVFFIPSPDPEVQTTFFGFHNPLYGMVPGFAFNFLFSLCVLGIIFLNKKARRHVAPRFVKLDSPPGVLLLRPFTEDTDFKIYASWGRDRLPTGFLQMLKVLKFTLRIQLPWRRGGAAFEFGEILEELTKSFGKVAAIGEPGAPPILGADNVYVSDDNWQQSVLEMAQGAKLVILTTGTTPGVIWEIENMLRIVPPSRLILNIPGMTPARRRKHYLNFRKSQEHLFPRGLPEQLRARAVCFNDDWTPHQDTKLEPPTGTSSNVAWWMSRVLP